MAANKGSKQLGSSKKAEVKRSSSWDLNKGSASVGPKTTNPKMVGKVAQAGSNRYEWLGLEANRYSGAKGSSAYTPGRRGSGFSSALSGEIKASEAANKGGGFSRKPKAKVVKNKKK